MNQLAISAWALLLGVLKRGYFLFFALFLDPFDLYVRFKADWMPDIPVPSWAWSAAFWGTLALAVLLAYHEMRMRAGTPAQRVTLLDVRDYFARKGWAIGGNSLDVMDLADAIRQGATLGEITVLGRLDKYGDMSMGLTKNEPRMRIPRTHFENYWIDVSGLVNATSNVDVRTYHPGSNNWSQGGYCDLVIELPSLMAWEKDMRRSFKGRRNAGHAREEAARRAAEMET